MTAIIVPKPLPFGGTIGIIAPAGPEKGKSCLPDIVALLQDWGYHVFVTSSCYTRCADYLAGESDEHRAEDLMMLFADEDVDAILCMRGGYGSNRLIPYFEKRNFDFSKYPKPFIGYSDITYLHLYLNQRHHLMTYHGPMMKDLLKNNELTTDSFKERITGKNNFILNEIPFFGHSAQLISGNLVGGNLTLICTSLGTANEIDTKDKILFIEEVDEPLYSIDRLLMHLYNSGKLQQAKGIILGNFNVEDRPACQQLLKNMLSPLGVPVAYQVDSGHCEPLLTLPLGGKVILNPAGKQIIFES